MTPNWSVQLPGHPYDGPDPDGFMPRDELVMLPGERELFELAESGVGSGGQELEGFFARFLSLTLGSGGAPGSCASLIASLQ